MMDLIQSEYTHINFAPGENRVVTNDSLVSAERKHWARSDLFDELGRQTARRG
jgi:hypothetical protein